MNTKQYANGTRTITLYFQTYFATLLCTGSRFIETHNFGFVALDILCAYPEDGGTYTCKATNPLGSAVTSAVLTCTGKIS